QRGRHCRERHELHRRGHAGTTSTGMPLSTAFPEMTSNNSSSASRLELTPAWLEAIDICTPGTSCPHPCGRLTTPGIIASVTSTSATTAPTRDDTFAERPSARPTRVASSGLTWSVHWALPFTSTLTLCIQELFDRRWR